MLRLNVLCCFFCLMHSALTTQSQIPGQLSAEEMAETEKSRFGRYIAQSANGLLESQASANFTVHYARCAWEVDPAVRYIRGKVTTCFIITQNTSSISLDLLDSLQVDSVVYHNQALAFTRPGNHTLSIPFPATLNAGIKDSVTTYYQGKPPAGTGFGAFSVSKHAGVPVIWTLSEPYGAREWWPCRNGLDDKTDSIDISITTPDTYYSASNGILADSAISGGKRTLYWKHRYPIASYLVAFATTNYIVQQDTVQLADKVLPLQQYVYPESVALYASAIPNTRRIMRLYERVFGPYSFRNERYAHTQCGFGGGMEHQTNSFVGGASENLIAHEMGHQWFGDKVTCGSWQDIWLNEGFATFMANYNFESYVSLSTLLGFYRPQLNSITSLPDGSVFVPDTTNVNRIFSSRLSYYKGAWVLQMLRWKLGDSAFFRGIRNYLNDPQTRYAFGRTADLKRNLEATARQDLTEFFKDWYYGEGYPSYQLSWTPIGSTQVRITLNQTTSHPSVDFFEMPVPVQFKNATRDTLIVINHTRNGQVEYRQIGFVPDTAIIDPYLRLISAKNTSVKTQDNGAGANSVLIFPNPVQDQFYILLRNINDPSVKITVHNAAGQLVWKQELGLVNGSELVTVPSGGWARGIYWVHIINSSVNTVKKILK